ncbi:filamentous hemagglutinin N-terminal domain-containing protein, partial [Salmonella enterica]|nr:filamentous hemagglutinin N-terminal domain-containing protein [Salmonella enterica]
MNKIYKLKYDRRRNQLVAVSELTTGAGKEATGSVGVECGLQGVSTFRRLLGILTPLAVLTGLVIGMLPGLALANPDLPVGGQVVAGQGSISTSGNQMTIHQGTHGLVTNWHSFDIGQNHTVQFVQPDSSAVALNRVTGGHESQILGTLTANGQVMLINPAGVMFGKGARVNTAGLLASTKNISTEDFMAGRYTFSGGSHPGAEIVNQGSLTTTKGGYIVLAADRVRNSGTLSTPSGKTVLAAADRVTLQLDNTGLASVSVNGSVVNALVENSGLIAATNGQVYLTARGKDMLLNTVVNNSGTVEARGLNHRGGEIVLDGGESGVVSQSGMLLADSETGRGGKITVQGTNIHLAGGSRTSATGRTGGGGVYVGGGWQGKDAAIRNASKVVMDRDGVIDVSATEKGDGGKAVLWSEDYTNFRGRILAKGGAQSGNGGQVETSSHHNLQAFGDVEASALNGRGGNWLLDPEDIKIINGTGNATESSGEGGIFTPGSGASSVSNATIEQRLNNGTSVTIKTAKEGSDTGSGGNITFESSISKTAGGNVSLTLDANGSINITNHNITSTKGKLNVNLYAAGSKNGNILLNNASITTNGGDITLGQWVENGATNTNKLGVSITGGSVLNAATASSPADTDGNITLTANNDTTLSGATLTGNNITVNVSNATGDALTINGGSNLTAATNLTVTGETNGAGNNYGIHTWNGSRFQAGNTVALTGRAESGGGDGAFNSGGITVSAPNVVITGASGANQTSSGSNIASGIKGGTITNTLSGGNLTLNGTANGSGATGVYLANASVSTNGTGNLTVNGNSSRGVGVNLNTSTLTGGNVTVTGTSGSSNNNTGKGLDIAGSHLNATTGNLSLTGRMNGAGGGFGTHIHGGNTFTAAESITVNGSARDGTNGGLNVNGGTFSAKNTELNGQSDQNNIGVKVGSTITVTQGNLSITGTANRINSASGVTGLMSDGTLNIDVLNGSLNITGNINDTGHNATSANTATGLKLSNTTTLNASESVSLNADMNGSTAGNAMILSGGNITAGESIALNGTVTGGSGSGVSLNGTSLNSTSGSGTVSLNANVANGTAVQVNGGCMSVSGHIVMTGTSAAGNGVTLSNATLTGGDVNVTGNVASGNGAGVSLTNVNVSASSGNITMSGKGYDSSNGSLSVTGNNTFSAKNTVLSGEAGRNNIGTQLSGNLNVAEGSLSVAGVTHHFNTDTGNAYRGLKADGLVLDVSNGNLTLSGQSLAYEGQGPQTGGTAGLELINSTLKADHAAVSGSSVDSGSGFILNNVTLNGGIAQGNNMTFSSNGSAPNVTNTLNINGGLGYGAFLEMQQAGIDNNTSIGALTASLKDLETYLNFSQDGGWTFSADSLNTSAAADKAGSWSVTGFTGLDATTNGSIILTGMNLTNSNLTGNSVTLQGANNASLTVQNTSLNATAGNVSLNADVTNGNALVLSGNNITASGDINLNGTTGGAGTAVQVSGGCMTASGNLAVTGTSAAGMGVALNGAHLSGGNVAVTGTTASGSKGVEVKGGSELTATNAQGNLTLTGTKTNNGNGYGIHIYGGNSLTAGETIALNGTAVDGNDGALNVDTNTFSAQNTVLTGTSSRNNIGVKAGGNINVTKGNLSVSGTTHQQNGGGYTGLLGSNLTLNVSQGDLSMEGYITGKNTGTTTALNLTNVTINAVNASLKGSNANSGVGFILNNVTLNGGIAQGNNMTFSSNGSAANVTNTLNVNGGLGYGAFKKIQQAGIDNNTSVLVTADAEELALMGFKNNSDWTFNASNAGEAAGGKAGEWGILFTNINASTSGNISLTGMNLTNSNLTGSSLTMQGANNGSLTVQNSNLTASTGNISLSTTNGTLTVSNVNLSSGGGHTTLSGTSEQSNGTGVKLGGNVSVTKGELTVNGTGNLKGIDAGNASVSLTSGALTMNGMVNAADSSSSSVGLDLSGSSTVLNATSANLTGVNGGNGYGFLLNADLQGGLTTKGNLTLSSNGSGGNATNQIGNRVNREVVKYMVDSNANIGSMTEVGINNLYNEDDLKGWINNGSLTKNFGDFALQFSGIDISTGSINLTGASFTDSTLTATSGNLTIDNGLVSLNLTGSTLNASGGAVSLTGGKGVNLTNGNISAQNDITINASHGGVIISGAGNNEPDRANITSTSGNISVFGHNPGTGKVTGVTLTNVSLNASQGNITVNGTTPGIWSGVRLTNVSMTSDMNKGYIDVYAESQGFGDTNDERGSLYFGGKGDFSAANLSFTGVNRRAGSATPSYNGAYNSAGIVFDQYSNVSFSGNTTLNATGGKGMAVWGGVSLGFSNGISAINAKAEAEGGDGYFGQGAIFFNNFYDNPVLNLSVNNGDLNITASSEGLKDVAAFNMADMGTNSGNGIKLSGNGNITLTGKSDGSTGLSAGMFNNEQLTGHLTINGQSSTGTGVLVNSSASSHLVNASINGISQTGTGLLVTTTGSASADLNGN